jgi:excisionase family DNA binding protein
VSNEMGGFESMFATIVRNVVREELHSHAMGVSGSLSTPRATGREYLTIMRAAEIAGVHACTIREWIKGGDLKAYRCGQRGYRILRGDLDTCLTVETADPTQEEIQGRVDAILAKQRAK